ncbi:MAG TPA: methyltransferase [Acidimicrobiales bacterium]|nr:methyltransferase [Acidimicrobiales bacterium]
MSEQPAKYLFDADEHDRIHAAEGLFDEGTKRLVGALGIEPGARCLEVGAGGGSIADWLCELVGGSGQVVATDIDTRSLESIQGRSNLQVRRHDIVRDSLEVGHYDLVHARLVLEHLPERDDVLAKLVRALRPGGWIVVEDVDYVSGIPISELGAVEHEHTQSVRLSVFAASGVAHHLGRELPTCLRAKGLVDVGNEGRVWVMEGGTAGARWFRYSMAHLRARLVGPDKLTDKEVDRMLELFEDPDWAAFSPIMVTAWGCMPR